MVWLRERERQGVLPVDLPWLVQTDRPCYSRDGALRASMPTLRAWFPWLEQGYRVRAYSMQGSTRCDYWLEGSVPSAGGVLPECSVCVEWSSFS